MGYVSPAVKEKFNLRKREGIGLILNSGIDYVRFGIFGSYARGEYKSTSDIDFCVIIKDYPPRAISGSLREDMDGIGADICFVTEEYFHNDQSAFARNLRRDFILLTKEDAYE